MYVLESQNTRSADFCADRIDVIANFAVIMNVVIKRVYLNTLSEGWNRDFAL